MLIQADTSREGKGGTDPDKDAGPIVVNVEVVLIDTPALFQFQVPAVFLLRSDCRHDARRFSRLQYADDLIRLGRFEIGLHKLIAPAVRRTQDWCSPFLGAVDHPVVKLCGNLAQDIPADRIEFPISTEETDDTLFLLKRLDETVEQNAVETAVMKSDVILVVLVERVHGHVSFQFSSNRRINPDASTSRFRAGLSSTRHLESCDGLRRRRV